jgi:hypothetical protein
VKIIKLVILRKRHDDRTILILYFDKTTVAIAEPIVYPR